MYIQLMLTAAIDEKRDTAGETLKNETYRTCGFARKE